MGKQKHYYITYTAPKSELSFRKRPHVRRTTIKQLRIDIHNGFMLIKDKPHRENGEVVKTDGYSRENIYVGDLCYSTLCNLIFDTYNPMYEGETIYITGENCNSLNMTIISDGLIISDTGGDWAIDSHPFGNAIQRYCKGFLFDMLNYNNFE